MSSGGSTTVVHRAAVEIGVRVAAGIDVDDDRPELRLDGEQPMPDLLGQSVALARRQTLVDHDAHVSAQALDLRVESKVRLCR